MNISASLVENKELEKTSKRNKIIAYIIDRVNEFGDVTKVRMQPDFIQFVCGIIENHSKEEEKARS